jgi:DUF971 family protein
MIDIIHVIKVEKLGGYRLRLRFSDGTEGERDFSDMVAEGGEMVEPLRESAFFARVFLECGVLIWPNGFAVDSIALHMEMKHCGLLRISGNRLETSTQQLLELVHVQKVEPRGGYRLRLRFSDGTEGERDFFDMIAEGGEMVEPLRDPGLFARVFIECGVLAWPNGFDLDPIALHMEMKELGLLRQATAA